MLCKSLYIRLPRWNSGKEPTTNVEDTVDLGSIPDWEDLEEEE